MVNEAIIRARMPEGTSTILEDRSLEEDYATLVPILRKGMSVLDVGCGTGAITKGIVDKVGDKGHAVGIDDSEYLIEKGRENFREINNLQLIHINLFNYFSEEKFDLIVAARILQWLDNPKDAFIKFKELLKPGGQVSILDYNHELLEWKPEPPESMKGFYQAFLTWRADAGMDNEMADHLIKYFEELRFQSIEVINANEIYKKGNANFKAKVGIWGKVAETRGRQMVKSGFIREELRMQAIQDYNEWIETKAESMIMKLKDVRGKY